VRTGLRAGVSAVLIIVAAFALRATYAHRAQEQQGRETHCTGKDFHAVWRSGSGALSTDVGWLELQMDGPAACALSSDPQLFVATVGGSPQDLNATLSSELSTWMGKPAPIATPNRLVIHTGDVVGVAIQFSAQSSCPYASMVGIRLSGSTSATAPLGLHTQCDGSSVAMSNFFLASRS
jgi:hypothetical protein